MSQYCSEDWQAQGGDMPCCFKLTTVTLTGSASPLGFGGALPHCAVPPRKRLPITLLGVAAEPPVSLLPATIAGLDLQAITGQQQPDSYGIHPAVLDSATHTAAAAPSRSMQAETGEHRALTTCNWKAEAWQAGLVQRWRGTQGGSREDASA